MAQQGAERRRNAAETRRELLRAAAELFAERGFDRTTVRDIAQRAGVNQALVFRYFGSKEGLFEEVMVGVGRDQLARVAPERLLAAVLGALLAPAEERDGFLEAFLRSGGGGGAVSAVRRRLGEDYAGTLRTLTDAPDAALRADLALAWLLGIGLMRVVAPKEPLASAASADVSALVLGALGTLLERTEGAERVTSAAVPGPRHEPPVEAGARLDPEYGAEPGSGRESEAGPEPGAGAGSRPQAS
ncbi:TetR/AcrR family transcriptional regulator [Streptomyces sp. GMY02]|uniref:helix-turn-helix domain-containing protein n=1 Tax=Streptomyces sp. GMY02 TaxID=1333528 RepID=UPI001C2C927F|nr:helix-turn-helix domain-containing protein [Streptomyces sp. GMY02]QXE33055.1 TetR/AcrR family transcriptional regulator [Streptomyces sp. GMY02]